MNTQGKRSRHRISRSRAAWGVRVLLVLAVACLSMLSCQFLLDSWNEQYIIGTWRGQIVTDDTLTFDADHTGVADPGDITFDWSLLDGKLHMEFVGITYDLNYDFAEGHDVLRIEWDRGSGTYTAYDRI